MPLPFEHARPNRTRARDRILPGASGKDNSILGSSVPPQHEILGATAAFVGLASVSDGAFGSLPRGRRSNLGCVDGRRWIISDEHTPGGFRERLRSYYFRTFNAILCGNRGRLEGV